MNGGRRKLGQAPILEPRDKRAFLARCASPRDEVMARFSFECGLRATEIGRVRWFMVIDPDGRVRPRMKLHHSASKGGYGGREVRISPALAIALETLWQAAAPRDDRGFVIQFRKHSTDTQIRSKSVQAFFRATYDEAGLREASSHSGRRTAITDIARALGLKNAQTFAGHRSVATTARYEEPEYAAIDRLVDELVVNAPRLVMAKASLHNGGVGDHVSSRKGRGVA